LECIAERRTFHKKVLDAPCKRSIATGHFYPMHSRRLRVARHRPAAEILLGRQLRGGRRIRRRLRSGLGRRVCLGSSTSWSASRPRAFSRTSSSSRHCLRADVARARGAVVLVAASAIRRPPRAPGWLSSADRGRRSGSARNVAAHTVPRPQWPIHSIACASTSSIPPVAAYLSNRWALWSVRWGHGGALSSQRGGECISDDI